MPTFKEIPDLNWEPEVLEKKVKAVRRNALIAIFVGIDGLFFFGILFGLYAIYAARDALIDSDVYGVGRGYRWVARAAQVVGGIGVVYWIATFVFGLH